MVYKSGQIFLPFCHNARVWRTDRQTNRILIARPRLHCMQRGKNGLDWVFNQTTEVYWWEYENDNKATSCLSTPSSIGYCISFRRYSHWSREIQFGRWVTNRFYLGICGPKFTKFSPRPGRVVRRRAINVLVRFSGGAYMFLPFYRAAWNADAV